MCKCIAKLAELRHIRQLNGENRENIGGWLFRAILALKPHQEHIYNIEDFIWCFCVNYITLNKIIEVVTYPIPRCNTVVGFLFGDGIWFWLCNAIHGYHQI